MPENFKVDLRGNTQPYCLYSHRSIPAGLRDKAKQEIETMLAQQVIEPVEIPTEWCSGLAIAPKKNGVIRMCVYLPRLNMGVKKNYSRFPELVICYPSCPKAECFPNWMQIQGFGK